MLGAALPTSLAGVLPIDESTLGRWGTAGPWRLPVGDPRELGRPSVPGGPGFQLNRGLERADGRVTHQGADLADGRAGDTVRAAASGLVVLAYDGSDGNGYGGHVVLAHRLEDDGLVYTVYAHLARGSVGVRAGEIVEAGDPLARVGSTGRASTPHLHFEVRMPDEPGERWEKAPVADPLAFVESRFADPPGGTAAGPAYVAWARNALLLAREGDADAPLTRGAWWRMLLRVAGPAGAHSASPADELRDRLIDAGLLPEEEAGAPADERLSWTELARDVKRLRQAGVRPPHGPLEAEAHLKECEARFGDRRPTTHTGALRRLHGDPTAADACVLLADVGGPRRDAQVRATPEAAARRATTHRRSGVKRTAGKRRGAPARVPGVKHGG